MESVEEKVKQKIVAVISALIPEAKIYLFGSRARGTHAKWSDIDLALDAGKKLPIEVVDEVKSMLGESNIPYKIDVLDFHVVSENMRDSIEKNRVIWKT